MNTPSGNILKEILLAGYVPGISSRGLGSVESAFENDDPDVVEVQDDFEMVTWDAVSDPSTHNAYFKSVGSTNRVQENVEKTQQPYISKIDELMMQIRCELSGVCCIK